MLQNTKTAFWINLVLRSVGQVALFHLGIFVFLISTLLLRNSLVQIPVYFTFFLIPLQVTYIRQGRETFFYSLVLSFVMLVVLWVGLANAGLSGLSVFPEIEGFRRIITTFISIQLLTIASLLGGLILINFYTQRRVLYRLFLSTLAAGTLGTIVILFLSRDSALISGLESYFKEATKLIAGLYTGDANIILPAELADPTLLVKAFWYYVISGFIFGYFVNLSISWYVGSVLVNRSYGKVGRLTILKKFKLPEFFIWPLIAAWSLVLLSHLVKLPFIYSLFLNVGLIFLFLYGIQGLSIIQHLLAKYNISGRWKTLLLLVMFMVLFFPPIAIAFYIIVPGLGVSEIWIKYRSRGKEKEEE
jgi:hypothetical protein